MRGDNTTLLQSTKQKLKVGLLEQRLGGTFWVRGVGDNDVEFVLVVFEKLEPIADVDLALGVLESLGHVGKVLLGETNDSL